MARDAALVTSVRAVRLSIAQLGPGQAGPRRRAVEGVRGAVAARGLVAAVAAVVGAVAAEAQGDAAAAAARKLIASTTTPACRRGFHGEHGGGGDRLRTDCPIPTYSECWCRHTVIQ